MSKIVNKLLHQVTHAQKLGEQILEISGLKSEGIIYTFATADVLVINCKDYETLWNFEEGQFKLQKTLALLKSSIQTISIEKSGKPIYSW
ncbi:MAG: hypothetical protein MUE44_08365 [Oscillatoriaceae cyanobacterium Prado104]|jgi:hypothetical protein|nr:hypothetical protein [Oscillatoriaceae cyanobacterium Prado104]